MPGVNRETILPTPCWSTKNRTVLRKSLHTSLNQVQIQNQASWSSPMFFWTCCTRTAVHFLSCISVTVCCGCCWFSVSVGSSVHRAAEGQSYQTAATDPRALEERGSSRGNKGPAWRGPALQWSPPYPNPVHRPAPASGFQGPLRCRVWRDQGERVRHLDLPASDTPDWRLPAFDSTVSWI